jgi:hypothetical protein
MQLFPHNTKTIPIAHTALSMHQAPVYTSLHLEELIHSLKRPWEVDPSIGVPTLQVRKPRYKRINDLSKITQ